MKTVVIIGASSGIGKATAEIFLKENYNVINVSRTNCEISGVENRLCDVTDRTALDETLQYLITKTPMYFIYCAGFSMSAPLEYVKEGDYRYLYEVNFFAFLHCLQVLLPSLRQTQGTACVVSSIAACVPIPFDCYYTSSKAALNALVSCLNYELEPEGVNVISIMPGGTKTHFTEKRKVYSPAEVDGYSKSMLLATQKLASIEKKGASPARVAKSVFTSCISSQKGVCSSCLKNKCIHLVSKLLPSKLLSALIKTTFFVEPEEE